MNREQKAATVEDIAEQIASAEAVFAVDYRGISVPEAAALRARLREADATFRVVKNSLTERAADKAGAESLRELLDGPTALTLVRGDLALAAKAVSDLARLTDALEFKGGLMGAQTLSADEIRSIARLPSREVLFTQVVGIVAAPLTGLVRGLNGLLAGVAVQLQQIVERGLLPGDRAPDEDSEAPSEATPTADQTEPEADAGADADQTERVQAADAADEPSQEAAEAAEPKEEA